MAASPRPLSTLVTVGASLVVIALLPLWILLAVPIILGAIATTPLAFTVLLSRVWIVYIDYFLTLFYRAVIRPNMAAAERGSTFLPGEITRRYNAQNLHQYRYPQSYPHPSSPIHSPPTLFSPDHARSRSNSARIQASSATDIAPEEQADRTRNAQPRSRLDADMESAGVWEDVATVAKQHSHRHRRLSGPTGAPAYLQHPHDPGVGILPSIGAQQSDMAHPRRRRSSGARYHEVLRLRKELEQRQRTGMHGEE